MAKKQFKAESKRLLDLMINSIYTHKEIFLREIISNASDAIDKLCYISLTDDGVGLNRGDFRIRVRVDKDARTITVSDNGIGMDKDEMENNNREVFAVECNDNNVSEGYEETKVLLQTGKPIDGIVCATDSIAVGCIHALNDAGYEIPKDVAVVGFDGFGYENMTNPRLTTIKQPLYEVGVCLADNLIAMLDHQQPKRSKILPKLVVNESA